VAFIRKIRDNTDMKDNVRLIFSVLWFPATGASIAGIMLFILTLGDYWEFLLWAAGAWVICTVTVIVVSLNA
jgi:hypothetical protein